jgi:PAS domain S-box-containing protein
VAAIAVSAAVARRVGATRAQRAGDDAAATFRAVFENAQEAIVIVDDEGRFLDANPAVEEVLGTTRAELLGRRPEHFADAARHGILAAIRSRVREGAPVRGDYVFELPSGERRWLEFTATGHFLPGRHLAVIRDCTDQRRSQEALELRAAQQSAIADLGLMALGGASLDALLQAAVSRIADTLRLEHVAILEGAPGGRLRAAAGADRAVDEAAGSTAIDVRNRDSVWGRLEVRGRRLPELTANDEAFLRSAANILSMTIAAAEDAEELRRRSAEIARLAAARQLIAAEALSAEDRARERISQDLHDELLQSLLVIRQDLAEAVRDPARADLVLRARDSVHDAIRNLRATVFDIHPVVLDRSGLRAAVRAVAQHHAQAGDLTIDVDVDDDAAGEHARLILSLVRELLTNVSRHAAAGHAQVRVWGEGGDVVLEVSDDGCGIDLAQARSALSRGHVGLASAGQRVEALNGRLELAARPGGGTTARVTLPRAS